jgi:hypothetical protein
LRFREILSRGPRLKRPTWYGTFFCALVDAHLIVARGPGAKPLAEWDFGRDAEGADGWALAIPAIPSFERNRLQD